MKTGMGLVLIGIGAILAFAVTTNTSVFNLHTAGYVLMVIGILGLAVPRRGYGWVGRRLTVRQTRRRLLECGSRDRVGRQILRENDLARRGAGVRERRKIDTQKAAVDASRAQHQRHPFLRRPSRHVARTKIARIEFFTPDLGDTIDAVAGLAGRAHPIGATRGRGLHVRANMAHDQRDAGGADAPQERAPRLAKLP